MWCAESCQIFERFTCALQWVPQTRGAISVSHNLDDFIFNSVSCLHDLNRFITLAEELYIPIKHEKTCFSSTLITVHDIGLDTAKWEARLPSDKVQKLQSSIADIYKCRSVTLQSLDCSILPAESSHLEEPFSVASTI